RRASFRITADRHSRGEAVVWQPDYWATGSGSYVRLPWAVNVVLHHPGHAIADSKARPGRAMIALHQGGGVMKVLLSSDQIQARILEMGKEIAADYQGREP